MRSQDGHRLAEDEVGGEQPAAKGAQLLQGKQLPSKALMLTSVGRLEACSVPKSSTSFIDDEAPSKKQ
jgi:hypothetical protein